MKSLRVALLAIAALAVGVSGSHIPISSLAQEQHGLLHGGFNDIHCKPSAKHPNPLILLHGLLGNSAGWSYMGIRFALKGYCAYSLDYGQLPNIPLVGGLKDLKESAQEVSDFVDKVLASTGASKVDIVGHSEGSLLPRVYLKYNGGATKTGKKVKTHSCVNGEKEWHR